MIADIVNFYNNVMSKRDVRLDNYYFIANPFQPIFAALIYLWLVTKVIPKYMENRKPYTLRKLLIVYNAFQVVLSAVIFIQTASLFSSSWLKCIPIDYSNSPLALHMVHYTYIYYLSKYIELLDTVLFVLRKKHNQVTFLHLYHHGGMPIFTFIAVKFAPGGSNSCIGSINSFVHIIMYGYYMLAALGPRVQKYLFWKKYITSLQLAQFVILLVHFLIVLFTPSCNVPRPIVYVFTINIVINLVLFYAFYQKTYTPKTNVQSSLPGTSKVSFTKENGKQL